MNGPDADRALVVVGSINMDLVVRAPRLPLPGETLLGEGFLSTPGGKGANQAVAAARLGASVTMVGCVGADAFGNTLRSALQADRVDVTHVHSIADQSSGIAVITVGADGANSIVVAAGANASLSAAHIDAAGELIAHADMLICQLEVPLATVEHAIALAAGSGTPVLLNPAPAQPLGDTLYARIDYLVVNESEAELLTELHVSDVASAGAAADALLAKGARNVLVTLGAQGVWWAGAQGAGHMAAPSATAVDSTAAGDTFAGGFAAARAAGASMHDAIGFGQRAAALCVTRMGAQASIPFRAEVEAGGIAVVPGHV